MAKKDASDAMKKIRNIGVMAHIDAGKTTVSERLLFITGKVHRMGEVHDGQAVMDWMPQEQERGITITSAATTFEWKGHDIHLIDTPGHVDFTMEVERSLRVLDGVITVLDGVEGVEPQTETVWHQANRFNIPRIVFVNKLDRFGASFERCLESLRKTFPEFTHMPLQLPIGLEGAHKGVVDLLNMKALLWDGDDPSAFTEDKIPSSMMGEVEQAREHLLESLGDLDDEIAEMFLEGEEIPLEKLTAAIRTGTLSGKFVPILCGSALKNRGIPPLLDAIVAYLPSPFDLPPIQGTNPKDGELIQREQIEKAPLLGLAFKVQIMDDGRRLTYLRLYAGKLSVGDAVYNVTKNEFERVSRIFLMHSATRQNVQSVSAGNIVGVLGLKKTTTGDTLATRDAPVILESIEGYEPVVHQAVEPMTLGDKEKLEETLAKLAEEDPTFRTHEDKETGQRLIAGMGELHLEIIVDRLRRQFNTDVRVGKPQVVFQETIQSPAKATGTFDRTHDEKRIFGQVSLKVEPTPRGSGVEFINQCNNPLLVKDYLDACKDGAMDIVRSGPVQGFPMNDLRIILQDVVFVEGSSNPVAYRIAAAEASRQACDKASPVLMEPLMSIEVSVVEENLGDAISSINERKGRVEEMFSRGSRRVVKAIVPLRKMFGYSSDLRTRTQGRGVFMMKFAHYDIIQGEAN